MHVVTKDGDKAPLQYLPMISRARGLDGIPVGLEKKNK